MIKNKNNLKQEILLNKSLLNIITPMGLEIKRNKMCIRDSIKVSRD